jgi:hypothetical protein
MNLAWVEMQEGFVMQISDGGFSKGCMLRRFCWDKGFVKWSCDHINNPFSCTISLKGNPESDADSIRRTIILFLGPSI